MATRDEIIQGFEFAVSQGKRTTSLFATGEWDWKRATGWTPKQVYSHLAAVAAAVPQLAQTLQGMPAESDLAAAMDINAMNDRMVTAMGAMSPEQVIGAFEANHAKLIEWLKALPDEQLQEKRRFLSDPVPVSDLLANLALHAVHHVYEANSRLGAEL